MLHNVKPIGASIGYYGDQEIFQTVIDDAGRNFVYAGIAPRKWNGFPDAQALASDEFIVQPGLVYRRMRTTTSWFRWLARRAKIWPTWASR